MTSQVYYRKWRPQTFNELVGQDHVATTLRQAVKESRAAHAYLFCGPRGTGKTTSARVLAKALNCLDPQDGDPCNVCSPCMTINEGRFMDLIEMDAASNRGIDEIRNIRERVNLSPSQGRYKVYIIDEAHMLTDYAANAFLKTLEEPPGHVIFVLCTTEPHKVLPTIISRCQRFDFRRLTSEVMVSRLITICQEEGIEAEQEVLHAIARSSGGSLRDAENLLEQLVTSGTDSRVSMENVRELLGLGDLEVAKELIAYLLAGNTAASLGAINRAAWEGIDLRQLLRQSVELLRGVLVLQWVGGTEAAGLEFSQDMLETLSTLATKIPKERVIRVLKLFGNVSMKHDAPSPLPLELVVVEACVEEKVSQPSAAIPKSSTEETPSPSTPVIPSSNRQDTPPIPAEVVTHNVEPENIPSTPPPSDSQPEIPSPLVMSSSKAQEEPTSLGSSQSATADGEITLEQWTALLRALSRYRGRRFNVGALLRDCKSRYLDGETLVMAFSHRSHLERMQEELEDPQSLMKINEAMAQSLGSPYTLSLILDGNATSTSPSSPTDSPLVRAALGMGGRVLEEREL